MAQIASSTLYACTLRQASNGAVTTTFSLFPNAEQRDALAKLATDSFELLELKSQCGVQAKRTAFACHGT